jgi:hypothetical protein
LNRTRTVHTAPLLLSGRTAAQGELLQEAGLGNLCRNLLLILSSLWIREIAAAETQIPCPKCRKLMAELGLSSSRALLPDGDEEGEVVDGPGKVDNRRQDDVYCSVC